jgi:hypothetical protein
MMRFSPLFWWFSIRTAFLYKHYPPSEEIAQPTLASTALFTCSLATPPGRYRHLAQPAQPKYLVELDRLLNPVSQEMKAFRQREEMSKLSIDIDKSERDRG